MRDLKPSDNNQLTIHDAISGDDVVLTYRTPTTSERVAYQRAQVKKQGKKVILRAGEARQEFGLKILTGVRDGDFGYDGQPISSDPKSPNYRPDWKQLVGETAGDLVEVLALTVFEGARSAAAPDLDFEEGGEEAAPLPTTSGD